jgi:hypothetical protein
MHDGRLRESELPDTPPGCRDDVVEGRKCISVIGIDRYRRWPLLNNAVSDARGVLKAFEGLGFEKIREPLFDDAATGDAIRCLPRLLEPALGHNDSLVVFFAGHGRTKVRRFPDDNYVVQTGYLIPVDAESDEQRDHTWQLVEPWLSEIAKLPPRHILVILDSCYGGVALSRETLHRGTGVRPDGSLIPEQGRRMRCVLTSALNNQPAMDGGSKEDHSAFTGYLVEALCGGVGVWQYQSHRVGVRRIAADVADRVREYSSSRQKPYLGCLECDDYGELYLSLDSRGAVQDPTRPQTDNERNESKPRTAETSMASAATASPPVFRENSHAQADAQPPLRGATISPAANPEPIWADRSAADSQSPVQNAVRPRLGPSKSKRAPVLKTPRVPEAGEQTSAVSGAECPRVVTTQRRGDAMGLPDRTEGWTLEPGVAAALDRQGEVRKRGVQVLTVVAGDALAAQTTWATWAAAHGYLTLATPSIGLDAAVADLLAQTPWLRCVPEARKRLAAAASIDVAAVDAELDARSGAERRRWIEDVARHDPHARVSGWLLWWLRCARASAPDPTTAPVQHTAELLAIACDLASPTAVLLFHPAPEERWLERAVVTAAELIQYLPEHSIAVTAPEELVTRILGERRPGNAWTMARQGLVRVEALATRRPGLARRSTMRNLFEALQRDSRTSGRFVLDGKVATKDGTAIDVALVAHDTRVAVELDAWYHFHDPEGYRRDRVQDARLQGAGYFVLRFPAEDVDDRLALTIEHLAIALAGRRAVRALLQENVHDSIS